jgi:virulence factor Mce-like protein
MRGRGGGIAGNPVLIGAATVLVLVVAVYLSYNANQGLPFVPAYDLEAELPDAGNLVAGNDVRIGGTRVGSVGAITPKTLDTGRVIAVLDLKLQKDVAPLPTDSTLIVRSRSALGLKYLEITRGHSAQGYADGATIPLVRATPQPVEIDQFFNMFDAPTRRAAQRNLEGFGDAFAGRGESLNSAIGSLRPLLRDVVPVMRNLSGPQTHLRRFWNTLGATAAIVAPVADEQAQLFVNLDTTFGALRRVARPYIQDSITRATPALDTAIRELPRQRPFLRNAEGLFRDLRPGARALRGAAPELAGALATGVRVLPRTPPLNRRLASLLDEVRTFSDDPLVPRGINALTGTLNALNPTLQYLAPAQLDCNYITLFFRNIASLLSEGDRHGTWQRFIIVASPQGPNSEGGPSSRPANGPSADNHLHSNPYPNTGAPGQPKECEAGNERYLAGRTLIGNAPGKQPDRTEGNP